MAPVAVEWFAEASPKLHTVTASDGQALSTPSLRERCRDRATPRALGRCEAMVEVWGMTASGVLPKTLWRPPAIGASVAGTTPRSTTRNADVAPPWRARSRKNAPER